MSRSRGLWLAPSALALLAVGCAHCDTCDDFPGPSPTVSYAGSYTPVVSSGEVITGPIIDGPISGQVITVPPTASIPGPFTATPSTNSLGESLPAIPGSDAAPSPTTAPLEPPLPSATPPLGQPPSSPPAANDGLSRRS